LTGRAVRQWLSKQMARLRRLGRALSGHEEDRIRVVHGIVLRLPIPYATKQRVLRWCMDGILESPRTDLRTQMRVAQADWNARGERRLNGLFSTDEVLEVPPSQSPVVTFILVTKEKAHLTLLSLESVLLFADVPYELIVVDNGSTDSTLAPSCASGTGTCPGNVMAAVLRT